MKQSPSRSICIQEVRGSNPLSSTIIDSTHNTSSGYLPISQKVRVPFTIPLVRLIEGFLLSCKVENKSSKTISFYKDIKGYHTVSYSCEIQFMRKPLPISMYAIFSNFLTGYTGVAYTPDLAFSHRFIGSQKLY